MTLGSNLVSLHTIACKEVGRVLRIWPQTLVPPVITMGLYFIIFGSFVGSKVPPIDGFSYINFIVPGIIMMAVITNSYMNVVSSFFSSKFMKSVEEILVSPTSPYVIVIGYTCGGAFRALIIGCLVTMLSLLFTRLHIYNLIVIIAFIFFTSVVFSLAGFFNGIFAKKFDDISIVPTFVLTPLTYLGGVFYSITLLPPFWQHLSRLNPILYMVNGFRYGFLGISDVNVWFALGMLMLFTAVLFIVDVKLVEKGYGLRN
jgi:ABC-2 type transport system permease protein